MSDSYRIRTLSREEVDVMVNWAAREGWNPGVHDAANFFAADAEGFLGGFFGDELIATISAVRYGEDFGFLGFYIVRPDARGKGYGLNLWNAAMEQLKGRNIGLDGVVEQQANYQKSGFQLAYRNIRHEGKGGGKAPDDANVVDLDTIPFDEVTTYDAAFFPADRSAFLRAWLDQSDTVTLGYRQAGGLSGYGVLRKCREGHKIGPLFADSPEIADTLFQALIARTQPEDLIYLDIPEPNEAAHALVSRYGMTVVFETARMYTGPAPDLSLQRLYGVTSFELG